jgi:hypothetical protein
MNRIPDRIFKKLMRLAPAFLTLEIANRLKATGESGMMDLHLNVLDKTKQHMKISLAHY